MTWVAAFLNALLGIFLVGAASHYLINLFSVSRPARFGAFCVATGFALGRYSANARLDHAGLEALASAAGAAIALALLWFWLMRHSSGEAGQAD